ncbi:MAG: Re/Si-specific NAD(P)(+) transhydrogenase subunit alpha [Actinomycetota bacterium]|nr:Re/Si-specific NAD(P)(+) transhydrogenase subunit alpha [Actinomycetota bacterium]
MESRDGGAAVSVGVPRETYPGERRVALAPASVPPLVKAGLTVLLESGAGAEAGFSDQAYTEREASIGSRRDALGADVVLQVRTLGANQEAGREDLDLLREGQIVIGMAAPLTAAEAARELAEHGVTLFAMELMPRISRAQGMDVLSSQATIAGYKAVLLAADALPKMFPMLTTAAGTVAPARVFVIGAGVAGLQAIATARRLGAVVEAYDVRPAVKEQVESLGAKFVELPLESADAEDRGGYAKAQDEDFYRRQRETMSRVVRASDIVITTALVPGVRAPLLVPADAVKGMAPGSVVVDLAAEQGGNCELTRADETVEVNGVRIMGPTNLPSTIPFHASQMYAKNVSSFLLRLVADGRIEVDLEDEITRETLATRDGDVVHPRIRQALGLEEKKPAAASPEGGNGR